MPSIYCQSELLVYICYSNPPSFLFNFIFSGMFLVQDVKDNPVMLYMKGVPDLPQCGFSSLAVRVLKHYSKI